MDFWVILFAIIFPLLLGIYGNPIFNGRDVGKLYKQGRETIVENPGKYKFLVRLKLSETIFQNETTIVRSNAFCGGNLVARDALITAAHCLVNLLREPSAEVTAGVIYVGDERGAQVQYMKDYYIYDLYNANFHKHDIAVIWLYKPFQLGSYVTVVDLPTHAMKMDNYVVTIVGWGTTETGYEPKMLQEAETKVISQESCRRAHHPVNVLNSMICALSDKRNIVQCKGDSGGPMIFHGILVGVASWAEGKKLRRSDGEVVDICDPAYPAVYTRVADYSAWVYNKLEAGPPCDQYLASEIVEATTTTTTAPTPIIKKKKKKKKILSCPSSNNNCVIL